MCILCHTCKMIFSILLRIINTIIIRFFMFVPCHFNYMCRLSKQFHTGNFLPFLHLCCRLYRFFWSGCLIRLSRWWRLCCRSRTAFRQHSHSILWLFLCLNLGLIISASYAKAANKNRSSYSYAPYMMYLSVFHIILHFLVVHSVKILLYIKNPSRNLSFKRFQKYINVHFPSP